LGFVFVLRSPLEFPSERPAFAFAFAFLAKESLSLSLLFPLAPPRRVPPRVEVALKAAPVPTSSSSTSFFLPLFNIGPFLAKA